MNNNIVTWLESWDNSVHNIEVGFDNNALLRGYVSSNNYESLDEFPDIDFFLQLNIFKPKLYKENEIVYGCIFCFMENSKYKVIYYYNRREYIVTDDNDTIIKWLKTNEQ